MENAGPPPRRAWRARRWILWTFVIALPAVVFVLFIITVRLGVRAFGVRAYTMSSSDMVPTLQRGDRFLVNALAYTTIGPQRGDVIIFTHRDPEEGEVLWVKRVVAVGGDVIECAGDKVILNGRVLHETYLAPADESGSWPDPTGPIAVPPGKFFVMGDSRQNSNDSRFFGFVDSTQIRGKVTYVYAAKDRSRDWTRVK